MTDIEQRIRERAHRLWLQEGRPEGRADEHWAAARHQIEAEVAAPQNPAAGNPIEAGEDETEIQAIGADAAANAAITGIPMAAGARRRRRTGA